MVMSLNPFKRRRWKLEDVPASVRLLARLQATSYTEEYAVIPFVFAALWYEGTQDLEQDDARAVTFSCTTSTDDTKDKTVFRGSNVTRKTGKQFSRFVYGLLRDLVNGGNNPDGLVLDGDDLHELDARFNKNPGHGFSVSLLGSMNTFYTGGRLCSLIVENTGRVVYACPVDAVTEINLAPLCDESFHDGGDA